MKTLTKKTAAKNGKPKTEMPHEVKLRKANELLAKANLAGLKTP
jgi:hypothetical protein